MAFRQELSQRLAGIFFPIYTNKYSKTIVIIEKGIRSSLQVVL